MEKHIPILLFLLLVLTLPHQFLLPQPAEQQAPEIFFSNIEGKTILFGGTVKTHGVGLPFFGIASGEWRAAFFAEISGYIVNAAECANKSFFVGTTYVDGFPAILLVEVSQGKEPKLISIYSDLPLFGVDLLPLNDTLYIAGYVYRYRPVRESDIIIIKYNVTTGKIVDFIVFGSVAFDDYPKRILYDGRNIVVAGDTYAYNVSQSDLLIARLTPDLRLLGDMAVGGAGQENLEDALLARDGSIILVGTTTGGDGTPDAFIAKVSDVGGILYLEEVAGYGNEFAISVSALNDSYIVTLYGEFEEEKTYTLLLSYPQQIYWNTMPQTIYIVNSSLGTPTPLKTHNNGFAIQSGNTLVTIAEEKKALCLDKNCSTITIRFLDFKKYAPAYFSTLYGWRAIYSVTKTREKPQLYTARLEQPLNEINLTITDFHIEAQQYEKKIDIPRELVKLIQRNMLLLVFVPVIVAFILLFYEIRRKK
uniref:Uncharacterized protein n=1 Tax=Thermofilum adornatum TaxID=1365176 RepID=A0A7C1GNI5_9CREN